MFYSNIVLSGGSTLFKGIFIYEGSIGCIHFITGFGDRLLSEMKKQTPRDIKIRVWCCNYSLVIKK